MNYTDRMGGFEAEFGRLVKDNEQHLRLLSFRVTKCEQVAKDIVQEVFLKLWEHKDQISEIENVNAWLYRVTENKLIDYLRKLAADKRLRQKTWNNIQAGAQDAAARLTTRESEFFISRAVNELPEQRQIIYRMNREQFLNYDEIASTLRISKHTVKNQISSALQSLRLRLKSLRS